MLMRSHSRRLLKKHVPDRSDRRMLGELKRYWSPCVWQIVLDGHHTSIMPRYISQNLAKPMMALARISHTELILKRNSTTKDTSAMAQVSTSISAF